MVVAPPPPTVDLARQDAEAGDLLRKRKGRASTFISNPLARSSGGVATAMLQAGTKQSMGQGA
jgi:hypothetical protein